MTKSLAVLAQKVDARVGFLSPAMRRQVRNRIQFDGFEQIRLEREKEYSHQFRIGDTGVGKSQLTLQDLLDAEQNGIACAVADPEREYVRKFYNPVRGDVIIDPTDNRCPYWNISTEGVDLFTFKTVAQSAFPSLGEDPTSKIFNLWTVSLFAFILDQFRPATEELGYWLSSLKKIDVLVKGTSYQHMVPKNAAPQRAGVMGLLATFADSLFMMPSREEGRPEFSVREWVRNPRGRWIFFASSTNTRKAVRPIQSLMMDLILVGLMSPEATESPVRLVYDELHLMQTLPMLPEAFTNIRKRGHAIIASIQNVEQLNRFYPALVKTMFSQPYTSWVFRNRDSYSAEYLSEHLGKREVIRRKEGLNTRGITETHSHNLSNDYVERPAFSPSDIKGMDNMNAIFTQPGFHDQIVAIPVTIPHISNLIPDTAPKYIARAIPARDIFDLDSEEEEGDEVKKVRQEREEQKQQFGSLLREFLRVTTEVIERQAKAVVSNAPEPEVDLNAFNPQRFLAEQQEKQGGETKAVVKRKGPYVPK